MDERVSDKVLAEYRATSRNGSDACKMARELQEYRAKLPLYEAALALADYLFPVEGHPPRLGFDGYAALVDAYRAARDRVQSSTPTEEAP